MQQVPFNSKPAVIVNGPIRHCFMQIVQSVDKKATLSWLGFDEFLSINLSISVFLEKVISRCFARRTDLSVKHQSVWILLFIIISGGSQFAWESGNVGVVSYFLFFCDIWFTQFRRHTYSTVISKKVS
tara:strand:+ start:2744 stop:3127 length:384 start_codon:yes stop_codon:yes gene_type:complete